MKNKYSIDFSKVIVEHLNSVMKKDEVDSISRLAKIERDALLMKHGYDLSFSLAYVKQRAAEIAYNSSRYDSLNEIQKAVLASNIALDKSKVIYALNRLDSPFFGLCYLENYINNLRYFKYNKKSIRDMSETEKTVYTFLTKYTKVLVNSFSQYFGDVEPHLLINMINEIMSFNPELLDSNKANANIVK